MGLDLVPDVVSGFHYFGSGFYSMWAAIMRHHWSRIYLCMLHLSPLYRIDYGFVNWDVKI